MEISFNDIINKEKGKIAIVIGLGPSLNLDIEVIKSLNRDKYVLICCNDYDLMTELVGDYWVHANSLDTIGKNYLRYNLRDSTIVFADSVDPTPRNVFERLLTGIYLPYDQRHFDGRHCTWGGGLNGRSYCCDNIINDRLTIQEELMRFTGFKTKYGTGDTVSLHMLSLSILIGCKNIFITGLDLDYSKGYTNGGVSNDSFNQYLPRIKSDFKIIYESAKHIGVDIHITNNQTPLKEIIEIKPISID
tara:strand:- start:4667 stop:5407 length:741 start_codon:yes stop_codon:yes gene_type:complete